MNMLRHHHVTYDGKSVTCANLAENSHQQTAGANRIQER